MNVQILSREEFAEKRQPYDQILPESVPMADIQPKLEAMRRFFRIAAAEIGEENEDWEVPVHYQHCRVFYAYLYGPQVFTPNLVEIICCTFSGVEDSWIGEFECHDMPGADRGWTDFLYLEQTFYFDGGDDLGELIPALGLKTAG